MWNVYFWKYDIPTCGTRPWWRFRRQWAWLGGLWHIWGHSLDFDFSRKNWIKKHFQCVFLKMWHTHLWDSAWLMLSTSISMTWRPVTYLRPFLIDFSWNFGYKTCAMCVFENMTIKKHFPCVFLKIWHSHLMDLARLMLTTSMSMAYRPPTYLRPFIDSSWKVG